MAARKPSRTDRFYLELFTHYGVHSVALAQGIYDRFVESYQDQTEQGQAEQKKLLSRLTEVLLHHQDLMIEGIEERQKAFAQEERVIYDSTDPADAYDEQSLSFMTMYGKLWIGTAHTGISVLQEFLFNTQSLTSEEIETCFEAIAKSLKQFHDLIESIRERHPL